VPVIADADRIRQVVANYLSNALKYSPEDRPVVVGIEVDDREARVWVRDEGLGLPTEEQEQIWERFHQATGIAVQSGSGIGLGLGLYICRTIIERHHGHVGVESAPGRGSTFWFTVPLAGHEVDAKTNPETSAETSDRLLLANLRADPRGAYGVSRRCGTPMGSAGGTSTSRWMPTAPRDTDQQNEDTTLP
jgi:hypothetical protein